MMFSQQVLISALGGILPALIWLLFWLEEDRKHPEPKRLLFLTFATGMLMVIPVLKLETIVYENLQNQTAWIILWSLIEEVGKLTAAAVIVLWRKEVDEPIDYVIYLVTTALGFAAVENTLFIFNPLSHGFATSATILVGVERFLGPTLLHIGASSAMGISMALAFYKNRVSKYLHIAFGLILAFVLHAAFNLSIMMGENNLLVSSLVWIAIIVIILLLEKVKKIHPTKDYS